MLPDKFQVISVTELSNIHVIVHRGVCVDKKIVNQPLLLKRTALSHTADFLAHHKIKSTHVYGNLGSVIAKFVKNKINDPSIISSKMHQYGINYGKVRSFFPILTVKKEGNALIGRFCKENKKIKKQILDIERGRGCIIDVNNQQLLDDLLDSIHVNLYYLSGKLHSKDNLLKKYGFEMEILKMRLEDYCSKFMLRNVTIYKLDQGFFDQLDSFAEKRKFISKIKAKYKDEVLLKLNGIYDLA